MKQTDVYRHIAAQRPHMSKSQKKIAEYSLETPNAGPFYTVSKLAKMTGVSEATIVRFATFLGYSGYPEMQQYMLDSVEKQLTTAERLEMSKSVYNEEEKGIYEIFQDDIANIRTTMETLASLAKATDWPSPEIERPSSKMPEAQKKYAPPEAPFAAVPAGFALTSVVCPDTSSWTNTSHALFVSPATRSAALVQKATRCPSAVWCRSRRWCYRRPCSRRR